MHRLFAVLASLALSIAGACGGESTPASSEDSNGGTAPVAIRLPAESGALPPSSVPFPEDDARLSCGEFGALELREPHPLLGDRLRMQGVAGMVEEPRPWNIMGAPEPSDSETRLYLETSRGEKLVIMFYETFSLAGEDVTTLIQEDAAANFPDAELEAPAMNVDGLRLYQLVPRALDTSREAVLTYALYIVAADGSVRIAVFYLSPGAATDREGCVQMAMRLASTLQPGPRTLMRDAHTWTLTVAGGPNVAQLALPADHVVVTQEGPDFYVHRIKQLVPFRSPARGGLLYFGGHPSARTGTTAGRLLSEASDWVFWEADDLFHGESVRELGPHLFAHAVVYAPTDAGRSILVDALSEAQLAAAP